MRIDEKTALKIFASKPNSLAMGTFCSMLVEYGVKLWEVQQDMNIEELIKQIQVKQNQTTLDKEEEA